MLKMCLLILCLAIEPYLLIWANKEFHQNLLKDSRNLLLGWVVLVDSGISFTAVYIWISTLLLNFHLQLAVVNNRRGICGKFLKSHTITFRWLFLLINHAFWDCKFYFLAYLFWFIYHCRLYRAYQNIYDSMHDKEIGPHKTQFRRDENYGTFFLFPWHFQLD